MVKSCERCETPTNAPRHTPPRIRLSLVSFDAHNPMRNTSILCHPKKCCSFLPLRQWRRRLVSGRRSPRHQLLGFSALLHFLSRGYPPPHPHPHPSHQVTGSKFLTRNVTMKLWSFSYRMKIVTSNFTGPVLP